MCFSLPSWGAETSLSLETSLSTQPIQKESALSLDDVLQRVLNKDINLRIKQLQEDSLTFDLATSQEQLDSRASLKSSLSDESKPTTNPFAPSGTNTALISGSIIQPLENGADLTLSASYVRSRSTYPSTVPLAFQSTLNPTYQEQIDLIYRYPLFKGNQNRAYQAQLQQIRANKHAAHWQVAMEKEKLAAQAMSLFFQMKANRVAIEMSHDAEKLLRYQKRREHFGLIEKADRLQANALLAARKLDWVNAQATWNNTQTSLNRLMHRAYQTPIKLHSSKLPIYPVLDVQTLQSIAQKHRAIFMMLDAQEEAAHALLVQVRENNQQQLDVIGQIGTRALSGSASAAFGQGLNLQNRYLALSLEWSDSLSQHDVKPNIQKAELALERIQLQREQALESINTELSQAVMQYQNAHMTQAKAQNRVAMERKKFNAEMQRYREGRSNTATIVQFEGELRSAELQALLQEIQMQWAIKRIQLSTGQLLKKD